jgi:hypothetical protein
VSNSNKFRNREKTLNSKDRRMDENVFANALSFKISSKFLVLKRAFKKLEFIKFENFYNFS